MTVPRLIWPDGIDVSGFLAEYWQRRPLLMRGAFLGLQSPLDADELAGLACEPEVESRIVRERGPEGPWQVSHGPFEEDAFQALPDSHWTLLVQDVDKHVPPVAELLARFDFLPEWRLDDIMISWAADQGSVGPHLDEYDVFLLQVQGRRRWRIDTRRTADRSIMPGLDLRILQHFDPDQDLLLEPGDLLYLPPGVPHWGTAQRPCMTWSVGLRAPAWRELTSDWLHHLVDLHCTDERWRDQPRHEPPAHPAALPQDLASAVAGRVRALLARASDAELTRWLGAMLTEPKANLTLLPPDPAWAATDVVALLRAEGGLTRDGASRLLYSAGADGAQGNGTVLLFANGDCHAVASKQTGFLAALCRRPSVRVQDLEPWLHDPACVDLLTTLFNSGHYIVPDTFDDPIG